jgi:hypothetical protein
MKKKSILSTTYDSGGRAEWTGVTGAETWVLRLLRSHSGAGRSRKSLEDKGKGTVLRSLRWLSLSGPAAGDAKEEPCPHPS